MEPTKALASLPVAYLWLIPFFPLAGSLLNGILTLAFAHGAEAHGQETHSHGSAARPPRSLSASIAIAAALGSFGVSLWGFALVAGSANPVMLVQKLYVWLPVEHFAGADVAFRLDALTAVMLLFITFVGSLIHIYSAGYMAHDPGFTRYFAYLNLFLFSMLLLVLADNMVLLFVGWEGVGLCSYLLISFWFEDPTKAEAGKKAFLTNRIGDAGFLVGVFLTLSAAGTVNFADLQGGISGISPAIATAIALALFVGAVGKSAQIPLYVWLPDAMAGPTPVSALIHAATMVTAGVYLIARLSFLFILSPLAMSVVALTGAVTALFAATIALAQYDIKKILAYSTISQLGYMFVGVGVGAFHAGIFHVMTHAFFKGLLFLGAGSVIHALEGEQDIRKMGGLFGKIRATAITFLIAWLAISGIPPLSGFFSKDEILWRALATENSLFPWMPAVLYSIGIVTAFLTAFYMTRLVAVTFFGSYRGDTLDSGVHGDAGSHDTHGGSHGGIGGIHESPAIMTVPLIVLALLSIAGGWVEIPHALGGHPFFENFLAPVVGGSTPAAHRISESLELPLMGLSALVAIAGVAMGLLAFLRFPELTERTVLRFETLRSLMERKYYVDEVYEGAILAPFRGLAESFSFRFIDTLLVEGTIGLLPATARYLSGLVRKLEPGLVRVYLAYLFAGAIALFYYYFWIFNATGMAR